MIKKKNINPLKLLKKLASIIKSFEKNPERNGNPQRLKFAKKSIKKTLLFLKYLTPIKRKSWDPKLIKIIRPQVKNNKALNKACLTIWKKQQYIWLKEIINIIIPNCLKVDIATIFFKSVSTQAIIPAEKEVNTEINRKSFDINKSFIIK